MKINTDRLYEFVHNLKKAEAGYCQLAMGSLYGEITNPMFDPETEKIDLTEVKEQIGAEAFLTLYPVAVDFFLSNEYPDHQTGKLWNALDVFLKKYDKKLTHTEKLYFTSMRSSYMGVYEVVDVEPGQSFTLHDLMKKNSEPIVVYEKELSKHVAKWNVLGARIVNVNEQSNLAAGTLLLERESVDELTAYIKRIDKEMSKHIDSFGDYPDPKLMIKKLWVKVIAEAWLRDEEEASNFVGEGDSELASLLDGDSSTEDMVRSMSRLDKEELKSLMDQQYQEWLDNKNPDLGNKTPRQAVKSKAGRNKVIDLMKHIENTQQNHSGFNGPLPEYDFSWMIDELGIEAKEMVG